jgi:sec-independent protein translocase protein TatC
MADADAVREPGLPASVPAAPGTAASGTPLTSGSSSAEPPVAQGEPAPPSAAAAPSAPAEPSVMSLADHLGELRTRILRTLAAVLAFGAVGYWQSGRIVDLLRSPIGDRQLISLSASGPFFLYLKIALVVGIILGMPVILYQVWAFVAPGLTQEERRVVRPWIPVAILFFAIGVGVAWLVLPFALTFLFSFESDAIAITLTIDNYFGFVTTMFLAFGLTMQFPIVLYVLSRVGIVTSARLKSSRRYVILGVAVFAAVVTPGGDLVSPGVLGLTMLLLYEISIFVIGRSGH